jgi:proteasome accessory factor C
MPRLAAEPRLRRLLALVPWVAANDGPSLAEVCARFDCTEEELLADLEMLWVCGLYPYTPDMLIDVDIADGRVWIRYADYFRRPLRLTPAEGLALVGAGAALLSVPGADPEGPLARALRKLATVLGVAGEETVEIDLGGAPADILANLQQASTAGRQVELDYYSFGRDGWATRVVDPWRVFSTGGAWYVSGYCHRAGGERLFRVDRVRSAAVLESAFAVDEPARDGPADPSVYSPRPEDPLVVLDLAPGARWVADQYPNEGLEELPHNRLRVRLRVSEQAWLERLLLRLGRDVEMVEGDAGLTSSAAARILLRYRGE